MSIVNIQLFRSVTLRPNARPSVPSVLDGENQQPLNPEGGGGDAQPPVPDHNKVSYNQADNKNATERAQARENIDVYSKSEVKEITGFRSNLNTQSKDNLVNAVNEANTWTIIEW